MNLRNIRTVLLLLILSITLSHNQGSTSLLAAAVEPTDSKPHYKVDWSVYHKHDHFEQRIKQLQTDTRLAQYLQVTQYAQQTQHGNALWILKFTDSHTVMHRSSHRKLRILLLFGEHARELVIVESALALLTNLTESLLSPQNSPTFIYASELLKRIELHIVPLVNPDGKLRLESSGDMCWRKTGTGIDLNRQTDWFFGDPRGSSSDPQSEEYSGLAPFSEVESQMIRSLAMQYNYTASVSVHSGEQQLFTPFVDSTSRELKRRSVNTEIELQIAKYIVDHMPHHWLRNSGQAWAQNDYSADGTIADWLSARAGVKCSFVVELYGTQAYKDCFVQFNPPPDKLAETLKTMNEFFPLFFQQVIERFGSRDSDSATATASFADMNQSLKGVKQRLDSAESKLQQLKLKQRRKF